MPQWRKLHIKATESLDINEMPDDFHRLLWVMLPLGLDREGRGLDNPAWVKAKIMPLRTDVTMEQIDSALSYFDKQGMIVKYEVDGRRYFYVPTWAQYQGNTNKEAESNYPPPPLQSNSRPTPDLIRSNSVTDSDADSDADSDSNVDSEKEEEGERRRSPIFSLYEQNIGAITPLVSEQLIEAENDFPIEWIEEAIRIAIDNNARSWAYARAILDRWQRDGFKSDTRKNGNGRQRTRQQANLELLDQIIEEEKSWQKKMKSPGS